MDDTSTIDRPTTRRRMLLVAGAGGLGLAAAACAPTLRGDNGQGGSTSSTTTAAGSCTPIPEETAGPYPGDGSNGPNVLSQDGVVRSDIRSSFGSASGVADGVPLIIRLTVTDTSSGCAPLAGAAVYLWHCDREGRYSMYSQGAEDENYLRGVQESDASGRVTFTSIFPACYDGRWPHIHFEVYPNLAAATGSRSRIATSQLAFPEEVCDAVYATSGYSRSVQNLDRVSLDRDMVFSDDHGSRQLAALSGNVSEGNVSEGYTATLTVPV